MSRAGEAEFDCPAGLRLLADWFDKKYPGTPDEVQRDLRRWAVEVERLREGYRLRTEELIAAQGEIDRLRGRDERNEQVAT